MKSRKVKAATRSKAYMKKLKGSIPLETEDNCLDENEDQDSDDNEDFEVQDSSVEEEVLPITDDESNVSENDEDNEGLPNLDSWGKRKGIYYNADFVDQDRGKSYREEDSEKANAELEAARLMQESLINDMLPDEMLFDDDGGNTLKFKEQQSKSDEEVDLTDSEKDDVPEWERREHEKRKYPKFLEYKEEFKKKFAEVNNKLAPLIELAESLKLDENFVYFIKLKYQIILHYMLNVSFYLYLKNAENVPKNHPIYERIDQFKQLDDQMNSHKNYLKEINFIIEKLRQNKEVPAFSKIHANRSQQQLDSQKGDSKVIEVDSPKKKKSKAKQFETEEERQILALYKEVKDQQKMSSLNTEVEEMEQDVNQGNSIEENSEEKRAITYQIAKNKGLMPRRKKEYRNPRVHHRMKFRKAKIRRKGQVRQVVKEIKRYTGEPTGISAHVVRSIKLK